jgi:lysophospholipase L1-like esterase
VRIRPAVAFGGMFRASGAWRRVLGLALALSCASVVSAEALASAASPTSGGFEWSVPPQISTYPGPAGLGQYATPPGAIGTFRWPVRLRANGACDPAVLYRWKVDLKTTFEGRGRCVVDQIFAREGVFSVTLQREQGGHLDEQTKQVAVRNWLIVALGDSVASGEGNPDIPSARGAVWQDARCHRSANAGVARAARLLQEHNQHTSVLFVDLACSGATIAQGLLAGYAGIAPPPHSHDLSAQVAELAQVQARAHRAPDAAVISIGANDVYFSAVAKFCAVQRRCYERPFDPAQPLARSAPGALPLPEVIQGALRHLADEYDRLAAALPASLPNDRVYLVEYFDPTRDAKGVFCRKVLGGPLPRLGIDQSEIRWLYTHLLRPLDDQVREAARRNGWRLVSGVESDFHDHGYCARKKRWIVTLTESLRRQGGLAGTLHPNGPGHEDIARRIYESLRFGLPPEGASVSPVGHASFEPAIPAGALGGVLGLGLLGGLALDRRRRNPPPDSSPQGAQAVETQAAGTIPFASDQPLSAGIAIARLLATSTGWVHRRVESVAMVEDTLRRRVSVDFTLPDWTPGMTVSWRQGQAWFAPIAVLAKQTLTSFDLCDETGRALPMPTSQQNGRVALLALEEAIALVAGEAIPEVARELIRRVVLEPVREARAAITDLSSAQQLPPGVRSAMRNGEVRDLAETLASGFIVLVEAEPGTRRIIKFSYEEPVQPVTPLRQLFGGRPLNWSGARDLLAARLGWRPLRVWFFVSDVGAAASYHFELAVAKDLEVIEGALRTTTIPGMHVGPPPRRRLHMQVAAPSGSTGIAWAALRAQRRGLLRGVLLLSGFVAAVLGGASVAAHTIATAPATAGPLLLAVPGAMAAYVSRPDDHPLTSRLLVGARFLALASALCSFAAAGLAALDPTTAVLERWMPFLAALAGDIFLLLVITYVFPRLRWDEAD